MLGRHASRSTQPKCVCLDKYSFSEKLELFVWCGVGVESGGGWVHMHSERVCKLEDNFLKLGLLLCWFWELNSGHQALKQRPCPSDHLTDPRLGITF